MIEVTGEVFHNNYNSAYQTYSYLTQFDWLGAIWKWGLYFD